MFRRTNKAETGTCVAERAGQMLPAKCLKTIRRSISEFRWQEKIANQRKDKLNKLSSAIVKSYDVICLEDLQIKNMVKNHTLAQSISDASWSAFTRQLSYKAKWHGKEVVKIDKFFPSSQTCHVCGHRNKGTKHLGVRTWICPNCHTEHDRDINAAVNILHEGLRILKIA